MSWQTAAVVRDCASRTRIAGALSRSFATYGNTARRLPRGRVKNQFASTSICENKHYDFGPADPVEAIKFRMEQDGTDAS